MIENTEKLTSSNVSVNVKNIMYISSILCFGLFSIAGLMISDNNILGLGLGLDSLFKSISYICYGFGVFCSSLLWYLGYNWNG